MGGQETLLLVARHPQLLAGAAALDSVTDLARRYDQLPQLPCARAASSAGASPTAPSSSRRSPARSAARRTSVQDEYAARSGISQARTIAGSGVPLQIWWSTEDRIVWDQEHQSQALYEELLRLDRCAPVTAYVGSWAHSKEMRASELLPIALQRLRAPARGREGAAALRPASSPRPPAPSAHDA